MNCRLLQNSFSFLATDIYAGEVSVAIVIEKMKKVKNVQLSYFFTVNM